MAIFIEHGDDTKLEESVVCALRTDPSAVNRVRPVQRVRLPVPDATITT